MNTDEQYRSWTQRRSTIDVRPDFADKVMNRMRSLNRRERQAAVVIFRIMDWINEHPVAQVVAVALTAVFTLAEGAVLLRLGIG
jgi:hypothetical protein